MPDHPQTIKIVGPPGRRLAFAVGRNRDGAFYNPATAEWQAQASAACFVLMPKLDAGCYVATLPPPQPDTDYTVHVVDRDTGQQMLWSSAASAASPDPSTGLGRSNNEPQPESLSHRGYTMIRQPCRPIELE